MNEDQFFIINSRTKREYVANYVAQLRSEPLMSVEIKEFTPDRTKAQNRLYWSWVKVFAKEVHGIVTRETKEAIHFDLAMSLMEPVIHMKDGVEYKVPRSTASLKVKEFTEYLEKIHATAIRMEYQLPFPDDYHIAMGSARS